MANYLRQTYHVSLLEKRESDTSHVSCDTYTIEVYKRTLSLLHNDSTLAVYCSSTNLFQPFLLIIIGHELEYKKNG